MSDRQNLAEQGTQFCLAAIGLIAGGATLAGFAVPAAVLGMIGYEWWTKCDTGTVKAAKKGALEALKASKDIREDQITAAHALLTEAGTRIKFDPTRMAELVQDGTLPDALVREVFPDNLTTEDPGTRTAVTLVLKAAFTAFRRNPRFEAAFTQDMVMRTLEAQNIQITLLEDLNAKVDQLIARERDSARQLGVQEGMLIALARRYAEGNPQDFDAALRGLERALEVASDEAEKGALPANTDDAVDAVLKRVDALNQAGDIDEAAALIAAEEARAEAGLLRLYDKGIAQAILTRDAQAACDYEVKKLPLDVPDPAAQFEVLRAVRRNWYERGRDKGLNLDLEVSIALAKASLARATTPDDRGAAGNDLGTALKTLGEREAGTARLGQAVEAYQNALLELPRDRAPLNWATTQMNLGTTLATLGEREAGTARLEQAITAYQNALLEYPRDRVPLNWAMTQNNLGTALRTLGERDPGTQRLEQAVAAYQNALLEFTRDRVPLNWATTIGNEAVGLTLLADRTDDLALAQRARAQLLQAEAVFRDGGHIPFADYCANQLPQTDAVIARLGGRS